ncbi:L-threonylcarbamoyladenylate synthase [Candidatus Halobonum tyrrellensis]|uniref:L-threonylcarbamoyladenylate synthase n=1 Tax=Candidatus Halobonum tyrrellensis G22 TaxID=1324957 RepID=V4GU49_9EURY|nr:L-threonylcarbamoyladenylate synthase [Candidatus Halobonum tyrrellensis]ESP88656.1 Sua5/YciO/YrdC/YwlC family protein [Candidatus Halobonum tyrrellensis G22]
MTTDPDADAVERAAEAVRAGRPVVYPTETVYGLGADATDADAVERVYDAKGRPRAKPLSVAFADADAALAATRAGDRAERFVRAFLPGPVTVVVERGPDFPDVLTAGEERVGVRVPDHEVARALARAAGPVTATSANRSGAGSVRRVDDLDPRVLEAVGAVLDTGETPGGESTVVDPEQGLIHRAGPAVDAVREWLASNP